MHHHKILIIGGGTAGISVAARLARAGLARDVGLIEPSGDHYYQPLWTLVAAGVFKLEDSRRETSSLIPKGVVWIQDAVKELSASGKRVVTKSGQVITYDWLIIASGVELFWDGIKGAADALKRPNVASIYSRDFVDKTKTMIDGATSGTFLFTFPKPPVKCAGAPQKIMYLADEMLRRRGVRDKFTIEYRSALAAIFGLPVFAEPLKKVVARKSIHTHFNQVLVEVRGQENKAVFADVATGAILGEMSYDYLHLVPPMRPHQFILDSDVCSHEGASAGWVDVDAFTLRHNRWPNVFALGDVAGTPNAKTGAAVRKQAPVLVENLLAAMAGQAGGARYDGYASCPLVTGFGKVILAEFGYDNKLLPSFPMDATRERRSMWWLKTIVLPRLYWNFMLRGRA